MLPHVQPYYRCLVIRDRLYVCEQLFDVSGVSLGMFLQGTVEIGHVGVVVTDALAAAEHEGVRGRDVTPFLLAAFHRDTGGESLRANVRLVLRNAELAARIAVAASG